MIQDGLRLGKIGKARVNDEVTKEYIKERLVEPGRKQKQCNCVMSPIHGTRLAQRDCPSHVL